VKHVEAVAPAATLEQRRRWGRCASCNHVITRVFVFKLFECSPHLVPLSLSRTQLYSDETRRDETMAGTDPSPRARQGSLELDYGDDAADMDYDQWSAAQLAANADAATTAKDIKPDLTSKATTTAPSSSSASLPPRPAANGLPANPLTGQRPPIASTSSAAPASGPAAQGGANAGGSGRSTVHGDRLAQTAVFLGDLHWVCPPVCPYFTRASFPTDSMQGFCPQWTSDRDVVELTQLAGIHGVSVKDVSFAEHKVNGKSKG
jgi:hypothetical protein